jgi:hypothetical protein
MASHDLGAESALRNSNVVKLPNAARRQVQNSALAIRAYRASQLAWPGDYKLPSERAAERLAKQSVLTRSPELLLLMCLLRELTHTQRLEIKSQVYETALHFGDPAAYVALDLITALSAHDKGGISQ